MIYWVTLFHSDKESASSKRWTERFNYSLLCMEEYHISLFSNAFIVSFDKKLSSFAQKIT